MKRWLKRLGVVFGVCTVCFIVFVTIEHFRGKWALQRRLAELRKQGEELSVAALEPKRPPTNQNVAIFLLLLKDRIDSVKTNFASSPPSLRLAAPGRAVVAWRLKEWSRDGRTTNHWSEVGSILNSASKLMEEIHSALAKPAFDGGYDYRKGFLNSDLYVPLALNKNLAQLLDIATLYELSQYRTDAANERLCALVRLVAHQKPEPLIVSQLVRQACAAMAFNATWQALQAPEWKEQELRNLQAAWQKCDFANDMAAALVMERAMTMDTFAQVLEDKEKLARFMEQREKAEEMTGGAFGMLATHGHVLRWINIPLWRIAWADQDELRSLNRWQLLIERERIARIKSWLALTEQSKVSQSADTPLWTTGGDNQEEVGWYERFRFLFSSELFVLSAPLIRRTLFAQTQQQMVLTVIALKRYQLHTGKLPNDLTALVPDYLSALPRDHMDGQSLRYRMLPEGRFVLYSVGEDGMDNGGNPAPVPGKEHYMQIWNGQDALWPAPANDEETASALRSYLN